MRRWHPLIGLACGSLLALGVLGYLMLEPRPHGSVHPPVTVYCAAALKSPMQAIAATYEAETGQRIEFEFGDSGHMLAAVTARSGADLFLPADDSFVGMARKRGLVAEVIPVCRMRAVALARPGVRVNAFDDLLDPALKLGIANPDSAAIGKVVRDHLTRLGKWDRLAAHMTTLFGTVTDSANAVELGGVNAAIVWDAVAVKYPSLATIRLPELDGAVARVEMAVLAGSQDPAAARRFARYSVAADRGAEQFRRSGYAEVAAGPPWNGGEP